MFWIVFNPEYPKPPKTQFTSYERALSVAQDMAQRMPRSEFFVLEVAARAVCMDGEKVYTKRWKGDEQRT